MSIGKFSNESEMISWARIFASLFCIVFIRIALESYSNLNQEGVFMPWQSFLLHIPLSYLAIYLSLLIVLYLITKENIKEVAVFLLYIHLFILIPPVVDFFLNRGSLHEIAYLALNSKELFKYFFKAMLPFGVNGITLGMHIAVYLLSATIAFFIFKKTKNISKTILGIFCIYTVMFLYESIPSFLMIVGNAIKNISLENPLTFASFLENSLIIRISKGYPTPIEINNEILMGQIFWLLVVFQLCILFYIYEKEKFVAFISNLRIERILNYILIAFVGIFIAIHGIGYNDFYNPINLVVLSVFLVMLILNAALAININDYEDINVDAISNKDRPLIRKDFTKKEWIKVRYSIILLMSLGIFLLGRLSFFFLVLAQALYFIYSSQPLRLKRNFVSASLVIGTTVVSVAMAGFFLVSSSESIFAFPIQAILVLGITQAILSNLKDIKDYEGDKKEGIKTLPVLLGLDVSKKIIAIMYCTVFIFLPIYFNLENMFTIAVLCAIFAAYLIVKKHYQEKYIFLVMFIYMLSLFLLWR